jgi:hypothetical protein
MEKAKISSRKSMEDKTNKKKVKTREKSQASQIKEIIKNKLEHKNKIDKKQTIENRIE